MSARTQEWIAFLIVGSVAGRMTWNVAGASVRNALSRWFLRKGHVKWAMRIRGNRKGCC